MPCTRTAQHQGPGAATIGMQGIHFSAIAVFYQKNADPRVPGRFVVQPAAPKPIPTRSTLDLSERSSSAWPAAPTRTEPPWTSGTAVDHIPCLKAMSVIMARTEAEQRVLDAVFERSFCEREDYSVGSPCETYYPEAVDIFEAYRAARRGLK